MLSVFQDRTLFSFFSFAPAINTTFVTWRHNLVEPQCSGDSDLEWRMDKTLFRNKFNYMLRLWYAHQERIRTWRLLRKHGLQRGRFLIVWPPGSQWEFRSTRHTLSSFDSCQVSQSKNKLSAKMCTPIAQQKNKGGRVEGKRRCSHQVMPGQLPYKEKEIEREGKMNAERLAIGGSIWLPCTEGKRRGKETSFSSNSEVVS